MDLPDSQCNTKPLSVDLVEKTYSEWDASVIIKKKTKSFLTEIPPRLGKTFLILSYLDEKKNASFWQTK